MRNDDIESEPLDRTGASRRLFLISDLLIVRECMASEISRRFPTIRFSHGSNIGEVQGMTPAPGDVVLIDATHEESGYDVDQLLGELEGVRAIVLTPDGVLDRFGPLMKSRPATLASLMALVGEACGVSEAESAREASSEHAWRELTPREREVALLLLEGKANKVIANESGLSDNTIKMHLTQIMRRLNVTNRTQVVLLLGAGREPAYAQPNGETHDTKPGKAGPSRFNEDPSFPTPSFDAA